MVTVNLSVHGRNSSSKAELQRHKIFFFFGRENFYIRSIWCKLNSADGYSENKRPFSFVKTQLGLGKISKKRTVALDESASSVYR